MKEVKIDPDKTEKIIYSTCPKSSSKEDLFLLGKTVSLCKSFIFDVPSKIDQLMDDFDIVPVDFEREEFIKQAIRILRVCKEQKESVDFDDMIWFNNVFNFVKPKFDYVFIDEQQDLTTGQINFALSCCKVDGRIIGLGDDRQSIYEWRGAEANAMANLQKRLSATELRLPISYRCPRKIVELAQEIVPDIQPAPNAIDGEIFNISVDDMLQHVKPGDFILSRVNAPLIKYCMLLLKQRVPANIAGRDIGNNLLFLLKKSKKKTLPSFLEWLDDWKVSEVQRLRENNRSPQLIVDKYDCLVNLSQGAKSLSDLEENINTLFKDLDDDKKVILSSIHKAKGLERDNVFLLWNTLKSHPEEESNIKYVAITRCKKNLYLVST